MSTLELRVRQRRGTLALAGRETRRVLSLWTQTILPPILTAVLFLAVFGGALGRRIHHVEGLPYVSFILPGLLVMTVAGQSFANCSTSLFQAKNEGYLEDVLSSPLRAWQLVVGYLAGGLTRAFAATVAIAVLALPFAHERARPRRRPAGRPRVRTAARAARHRGRRRGRASGRRQRTTASLATTAAAS